MLGKKARWIVLSLSLCGAPLLASATAAPAASTRAASTGVEEIVFLPKPFRGMLLRINNHRDLTFIIPGYPLGGRQALREVRVSAKTQLYSADGQPLPLRDLAPTDQFVGMVNAWDGTAITLMKL